jgi:hypothetical protein
MSTMGDIGLRASRTSGCKRRGACKVRRPVLLALQLKVLPAILTQGVGTLHSSARARTLQLSSSGRQAKGVHSWKLPRVAGITWKVSRQHHYL